VHTVSSIDRLLLAGVNGSVNKNNLCCNAQNTVDSAVVFGHYSLTGSEVLPMENKMTTQKTVSCILMVRRYS
jgi:hypothetical protein